MSHHIQSLTQKNKVLNIRAKTIKLLEENKGVILHDLGLGNGFLDMTLKAQAIKEIQKNGASPKCKTFDLNITIKKVKRQPTEREKMFESNMSDKGLISRIYKEHLQLNKKNFFKWAGNSLAVQWLGLCPFTAKGAGSIPGRGTQIPQAKQCGQ